METDQVPNETTDLRKSDVWNTVTPFSKYLAMTLFVLLPFIGAWIGYNFALTKSVVVSERVDQSTAENTSDVDEQISIPDDQGKLIEGPVVPLAPKDYQKTYTQFWASDYFELDGQIYYSESYGATTSRLLEGVEAESFVPHTSDGFPYAKDENGVICNDRRADFIDLPTFEFVLRGGDTWISHESIDHDQWTNVYTKDKNFVFFDCHIVEGADPDSFEIISASYRDAYGRDADSVFFEDQEMLDADVDSFQPSQALYATDNFNVFRKGDKVGSLITEFPEDFTGTTTLITIAQNQTFFLLMHDDGEVDVLISIPASEDWSYPANILPDLATQKLYFASASGTVQEMDLINQSVTTLNLGGDSHALNAMMLEGTALYYLRGKNCPGFKGRCDLSLYVYDLQSKSEKPLASNLAVREILGIKENKVHLAYRDGDAGCLSARHYYYDLDNGLIESLGSHGGCDESENEAYANWITNLTEGMSGVRAVREVIFEDGKIIGTK